MVANISLYTVLTVLYKCIFPDVQKITQCLCGHVVQSVLYTRREHNLTVSKFMSLRYSHFCAVHLKSRVTDLHYNFKKSSSVIYFVQSSHREGGFLFNCQYVFTISLLSPSEKRQCSFIALYLSMCMSSTLEMGPVLLKSFILYLHYFAIISLGEGCGCCI